MDDEREDVVNESVQGLVCQHSPRQMGDRFHFVVDEQLGSHHDEAKGEKEAVHHTQHVRVPAFVFVVHQGVHRVADQQWNEQHAEVLESHSVVVLSRRFTVRRAFFEFERNEA